MTKLLIITDSLGLPRTNPEIVTLEETWPSLVESALPNVKVIRLSLGGATIGELLRQGKYYNATEADFVVVQSGIVDCAPRALTKDENRFINSSRLLSRTLSPIIHRSSKALRKIRKLSYTSPQRFQANIESFQSEFGAGRVFWIGIAPTSAAYEEKLSGIAAAVKKYNAILEGALREHYIGIEELPPDGLMSDFHHLNASGHAWLAEKILQILPESLGNPA